MINAIPIKDLKEHQEDSTCHCRPSLIMENGEMILVHNSFDGREIAEQEEMKSLDAQFTIGQRVYHCAFGWGNVNMYVPGDENMLVDLDAIEVKYYVMGQGYKTMKGVKGQGIKTLYCKCSEVAKSDKDMTSQQNLLAMCLNAKITLPKGTNNQ